MISAIILAAGESERMGSCKQLLNIGEKTMIERVFETVMCSQVDEIIIVLGYNAEQIQDKLPESGFEVIYNPDFREGMGSSLKTGIGEVGEDAEAVLIVLADQPLLEPEVIDRLIERYEESDDLIVAPAYKGERGHPVLLDISLKKELMNIEGDIGARNILKNRKKDFSKIEVETPSVVMDIDTNKDIEKIERMRKYKHEK